MNTTATHAGPAEAPLFVPPTGRARIDPKRLATLRAEAALAGATLIDTDDDHGRTMFVVSRGAITKRFLDLSMLEEFLRDGGVIAAPPKE